MCESCSHLLMAIFSAMYFCRRESILEMWLSITSYTYSFLETIFQQMDFVLGF